MKASTLQLVFGKRNAFQRNRDMSFEEVDDIFSVVNEQGYKYSANRFQQGRFWKAVTTRFWQYDDFSFPGAAAASYLGNAHRFKIWFNPLEAYRLFITAGMDLYSDALQESKPKKKKGKKGKKVEEVNPDSVEARQEEKSIVEKEWEALLKGNSKKEKTLTSKYGWSRALYKELEKSKEEGAWTEKGWHLWNHAITTSAYLSENVVAVMVHEMMHIIWNHIARNGKRDPQQWNLATDFAINQCCDFTTEVRKVCITNENETFFGRFIISYMRHLLQTDKDVRKDVKKKYNLSLDQEIKEFAEIAQPRVAELHEEFMMDGDYWQRADKTEKKSADYYYRILEETMIFSGEGDGEGEGEGEGQPGDGKGKGKGQGNGAGSVRGYDDHADWDKIAEDDDSDGEDEGEGEGEGDGDEEGKDGQGNQDKQEGGKIDQSRLPSKGSKGKKGGKDGKGSKGGSRSKDRGKGTGRGAIHDGFDVTTACARQETKGVLRDALERAGFNPDNPNELARALQREAGLESLGAYISEFFKVRTKNWKQILASYVATAVNPQDFDYTMSRENRRVKGMFPGKRRERGIDLVVAVDTSGSINYNDYNDFVNQIEKIVRDCDVRQVRMIQCHHSIALDRKVLLSRIKKIPVVETGGTTMKVIYDKLKGENNRKLLVLFTDGCIDHFTDEGWGFKSIMFLSRGNECYAPALVERGFKVICQDEE